MVLINQPMASFLGNVPSTFATYCNSPTTNDFFCSIHTMSPWTPPTAFGATRRPQVDLRSSNTWESKGFPPPPMHPEARDHGGCLLSSYYVLYIICTEKIVKIWMILEKKCGAFPPSWEHLKDPHLYSTTPRKKDIIEGLVTTIIP